MIEIVDTTIDGNVTPIGAVDPDVGIDFTMEVFDLTAGAGNDFNTSETDLIIRSSSGGTTLITDCGDEGILIRNFGDDGPTATNAGRADVRIGSANAGEGITSSNNVDEGLQVEAGLDGEINLHVQNSVFESNSGDLAGDRDVLVGVRSVGNRTIDSYIADSTIEHEIRIESDNTLATTHQFGCDDDGNAGNGTPCSGPLSIDELPDPATAEAEISAVLTENGVTHGTVDTAFSGGDVDIVDETTVLGQTP